MKQLQTPTGLRIDGVFEIVPGKALISGFNLNAEGKPEPDYAGETKLWWDEQRSVTGVDDLSKSPWSNVPNSGTAYICRTGGDFIYIDEEGGEWRLNDLTVIEDTEDE